MPVRFQSGHIWTIFGSVVYGPGHCALYLQQFLYELAVLIFFPINWLITFLATSVIGRRSSDYTLNPYVGVGAQALGKYSVEDLQSIKHHILSQSTIPLTNHQLISLFDSLPIATTQDMLAYWTGHIVRSRSLLDLVDMTLCQLQYLGFSWGKRYRSPYIGDPLVLSFLNTIHIPIIIWGNVQVNDIQYRGKVNATMVYDNQPWQDYFRILDDGSTTGNIVILGIWASKHKIGGWFTLTSNPSATTALSPHHRLHTPASYQHKTGSHVSNITQQFAVAASRQHKST